MAIDLFQQWALVFESKTALGYLPEVYRELKAGGEYRQLYVTYTAV
jgi:hypothetical protein